MKAFVIAVIAVTGVVGQDVPQWIRDAASLPAPSYPPKVASVVLLQEEQVNVDGDGRRVMRERGAVRILQQGNHGLAAYRRYNVKSGRIREFQGWLLPPLGKPTVYPKNAVIDVALSTEYTYDEERARVLEPRGDLTPGCVFAWEVVEEEKTVFTQYHYSFQETTPVLVSRFVLSLPPSWEVRGTIFNRDPLEPRVDGNTYTWELHDLPWIEPEEHSPYYHALAPRLGINYYPASDARPDLRPLKDWAATSTWLAGFADPAAAVTEGIRAKAAALTAGAKTEAEKIDAIARFAQKTNYVEVAMNIERGGGYTPHAAAEVLARNYGDCKDKAALTRALLAAIGIKSYAISIFSGDRQFVRPEWPTSLQFNHAIVAIAVSPETKFPTVIEHPQLGRLLIFDPTSTATPLGDLPEYEQGSYALVEAGAKGELLRMPLLPPESNRVESVSDAQLALDGQLSAHVERRYFGQSARPLRSRLQRRDQDDLKKGFEESLTRRLGGMKLERIEPADRFDSNELQLNMDIQVRQFGRFMQQKMLMVSPGALIPETGYAFPAKPRKWPVRLFASVHRDSVGIALPPEFKVDEMPDPIKIDTAYGTYVAEWKVTGNQLLFKQSLEVKDTTAPASEYARIREFFDRVNSGQHAAVVLLKQ
jgi:hypothetical protein